MVGVRIDSLLSGVLRNNVDPKLPGVPETGGGVADLIPIPIPDLGVRITELEYASPTRLLGGLFGSVVSRCGEEVGDDTVDAGGVLRTAPIVITLDILPGRGAV